MAPAHRCQHSTQWLRCRGKGLECDNSGCRPPTQGRPAELPYVGADINDCGRRYARRCDAHRDSVRRRGARSPRPQRSKTAGGEGNGSDVERPVESVESRSATPIPTLGHRSPVATERVRGVGANGREKYGSRLNRLPPHWDALSSAREWRSRSALAHVADEDSRTRPAKWEGRCRRRTRMIGGEIPYQLVGEQPAVSGRKAQWRRVARDDTTAR